MTHLSACMKTIALVKVYDNTRTKVQVTWFLPPTLSSAFESLPLFCCNGKNGAQGRPLK